MSLFVFCYPFHGDYDLCFCFVVFLYLGYDFYPVFCQESDVYQANDVCQEICVYQESEQEANDDELENGASRESENDFWQENGASQGTCVFQESEQENEPENELENERGSEKESEKENDVYQEILSSVKSFLSDPLLGSLPDFHRPCPTFC